MAEFAGDRPFQTRDSVAGVLENAPAVLSEDPGLLLGSTGRDFATRSSA